MNVIEFPGPELAIERYARGTRAEISRAPEAFPWLGFWSGFWTQLDVTCYARV
jgi:hypothetical protein